MSFPKNQTHEDFLEDLKQLIEEKGELSRPEIGTEFEDGKMAVAGSTAKSYLSTHRERIEELTDLESVEKPHKDSSGGDPTVYWRLDNK